MHAALPAPPTAPSPFETAAGTLDEGRRRFTSLRRPATARRRRTDSRRQPGRRPALIGLGAASQALDALLLGGFHALGAIGPEAPLLLGAAAATLFAVFLRRRADVTDAPSAVGPGALLALGACSLLHLALAAQVPQVGWLLLTSLSILGGLMALGSASWRGALVAGLLALPAAWVITRSGQPPALPAQGLEQQLLSGLWCALVLARVIGLGLCGAQLRSQLAEAVGTLDQLSQHDPVTGTLDRQRVLDVVAARQKRWLQAGDTRPRLVDAEDPADPDEGRRPSREPSFGLVRLDVDHLGDINRRFGHGAGDEVLRRLASSAAAVLRRDDAIGRYGSAGFLLVLGGIDRPAEACATAARVVHSFAALPWHALHTELAATASAGVAICGEGETAEALLARAGAALRVARVEGRNRVHANPGAGAAPGPAGRPLPMAPLDDTIADAEVP